MWKCENCSEELDDAFDACWNCGTSIQGETNPEFQPVVDPFVEPRTPEETTPPIQKTPAAERTHPTSKCRDCGIALTFVEEISLMKLNKNLLVRLLAAFNDADDLQVFPVTVFRCPRCSRLEFYDLAHQGE